MAAPRELNARERKRVYMHSTIFDSGGPTSKSIYTQNQQNDIYQQLGDSLKPREPPSMNLPRPSDIQCTQNAGHGVVIPSNIGVDRRGCPGQAPPTATAASFQGYVPRGSTPRISGPEVLVTDGDPMPVLKAGGKDHSTIPQEFWQTSVNLQWHDPRNELSRQNKNRNKEMGAQELKLQEMSSEIFGKVRMKNSSTDRPGADLLSTEADYLQVDSALNPNLRQERNPEQQQVSAYDRFTQNLSSSNQNTMTKADQAAPPPMPYEEDPNTIPRRRQEKNFSDLFGTQMGERREIRGREEVIGARTCSFLDTRSEIAARNKEHWRPGHSDVEGPDLKERPKVSNLRKEAERDSRVFDVTSPQKPRANTEEVEVTGNERACWDTKDIMQSGSEIARRGRLKDFHVDQSPQDRRLVSLASQQVRRGIGGDYDDCQPQFSPRGSSARSNRLTDPSRVAAGGFDERPMSAKDTKLASLQSSIFG